MKNLKIRTAKRSIAIAWKTRNTKEGKRYNYNEKIKAELGYIRVVSNN